MVKTNDYDKFVDDMWFVGDSDLGELPEVAYLSLCIAGEAGEISEKLKKAFRDSGGKFDSMAMLHEIGDLIFYLVRFAHRMDCNLNDVLEANMAKLNRRRKAGTLRGSGDSR